MDDCWLTYGVVLLEHGTAMMNHRLATSPPIKLTVGSCLVALFSHRGNDGQFTRWMSCYLHSLNLGFIFHLSQKRLYQSISTRSQQRFCHCRSDRWTKLTEFPPPSASIALPTSALPLCCAHNLSRAVTLHPFGWIFLERFRLFCRYWLTKLPAV